jgi:hypothetical protein
VCPPSSVIEQHFYSLCVKQFDSSADCPILHGQFDVRSVFTLSFKRISCLRGNLKYLTILYEEMKW